jgi:hypothetical protein
MFWFQQETDLDRLALASIRSGDIMRAMDIWRKSIAGGPIAEGNCSGYRNLSLLYILSCMQETSLLSKEEVIHGLNWYFHFWNFFFSNKLYQRLPGAGYINDASGLSARFVQEFALGFRKYMASGILFTLDDLLGCFHDLPECDDLKAALSKEFSKAPLEILDRRIEQAVLDLEDEKADGWAVGNTLAQTVKAVHAEAKNLMTQEAYLLISDKLAETILSAASHCMHAVDKSKERDIQYQQTKRLAEIAAEMAVSDVTISRVTKDMLGFEKLYHQSRYMDQLEEIISTLPANIYKLSAQEIDDYPIYVMAALNKVDDLLERLNSDPLVQGSDLKINDIVSLRFMNIIIAYANHTYKYKSLVDVINKLATYKVSDSKTVDYFNKNVEILEKNMKAEKENSGCMPVFLLIAVSAYLITKFM